MGRGMRISKEQYAIARANGIPNDTTYNRVYNCGWDVEKAITQPVRKKKEVEYPEGLEEKGISKNAYYLRITKYGWSEERAATESYEETAKRNGAKRRVTPKRKYPIGYINLAFNNGISYNMFADRVRSGWTMQDAATLPKGARNYRRQKLMHGKFNPNN